MSVDASGVVHCLDAASGKQHWGYDLLADSHAAPLIVDDQVYVVDDDGCVSIFRLSADRKIAMKDGVPINAEVNGEVVNAGASVFVSPVFANGVLYVASRSHLFAIANSGAEQAPSLGHGRKRSYGANVRS